MENFTWQPRFEPPTVEEVGDNRTCLVIPRDKTTWMDMGGRDVRSYWKEYTAWHPMPPKAEKPKAEKPKRWTVKPDKRIGSDGGIFVLDEGKMLSNAKLKIDWVAFSKCCEDYLNEAHP